MRKMEFSFDDSQLDAATAAFRRMVDSHEMSLKDAAKEVRIDLESARRILSGERLYGKTIFRLIDWYDHRSDYADRKRASTRAVRVLIEYIRRGPKLSHRIKRQQGVINKILAETEECVKQ